MAKTKITAVLVANAKIQKEEEEAAARAAQATAQARKKTALTWKLLPYQGHMHELVDGDEVRMRVGARKGEVFYINSVDMIAKKFYLQDSNAVHLELAHVKTDFEFTGTSKPQLLKSRLSDKRDCKFKGNYSNLDEGAHNPSEANGNDSKSEDDDEETDDVVAYLELRGRESIPSSWRVVGSIQSKPVYAKPTITAADRAFLKEVATSKRPYDMTKRNAKKAERKAAYDAEVKKAKLTITPEERAFLIANAKSKRPYDMTKRNAKKAEAAKKAKQPVVEEESSDEESSDSSSDGLSQENVQSAMSQLSKEADAVPEEQNSDDESSDSDDESSDSDDESSDTSGSRGDAN